MLKWAGNEILRSCQILQSSVGDYFQRVEDENMRIKAMIENIDQMAVKNIEWEKSKYFELQKK